MSKAANRNALSVGLAVGLIACGRDQLPAASKMSIEFAFQHAWRRWPHRSHFPAIRLGGPGSVDTILQMTHADRHKHVPHLYWDTTDGWGVIHARHAPSPFDLDLEGVAEHLGGSVSVEAWRKLAADFLSELEGHQN